MFFSGLSAIRHRQADPLEGSDEFFLKRLIFEAQTLFMTSIQTQVLSAGLPGTSDSGATNASLSRRTVWSG
jgi:hypothetical protein